MAMMQECDASGMLPNWKPPIPEEVVAWHNGLVKAASGVEEGMIHPMMSDEVEQIRRRVAATQLY